MATPTVYIKVTPNPPVPYDLLSVAEVQVGSRHAEFEYQTVCGDRVGVAPDICAFREPEELFDPNKPDTYELSGVSSRTVVLYAKTTCRLVGRDRSTLDSQAMQALNYGEGNGLAVVLREMADADADTVALTPSVGELSGDIVEAALAKAENAARSYAGGGVILMPTILASLAGLSISGNNLQTSLGTKVAVYETDPNDTSWKMYVFARVVVTKGVAIIPDLAVMQESNEFMVMAERPYAVGYECAPTIVEVSTA